MTFRCIAWVDSRRQIMRTYYGKYLISTIFLIIDHGFGVSESPILWETMVFKNEFPSNEELENELESFQKRYSSKKDALAGHQEIVNQIIEE